MKSLKKSLVTLLACTMALAPCMAGNMPVSAADETASIAITVGDKESHTYQAYQLFSGDIVGGELWNIVWGSGVDGAALLTALKDTTNEVLVNKFKDCTSAYDVAGILEANQGTAGFSEAFAEIVSKHLIGTPAEASGKDSVTIENLTPGYYFVKDADGSLAGLNGAYTRFIMKLLSKTETATAKSDLPTLDKVINEGDGDTANTASIGDDVEFKLTSKVPDMTGYNKYFFVVNDELSEGFTFNDDVKIKIGTSELDADAFYVTDLGDGEIKIVIRDFISYQLKKGQTIEITYSAALNSEADLGEDGNTNVANLIYSNNPNYEYKGNVDGDSDTDDDYPDEPYTPTPDNPNTPEDESTKDDPDTPDVDESKPEPTGDTPEITTVTYATTLQIIKVDGDDKDTLLSGAEFTIYKWNGEGEKTDKANYTQVGAADTTKDNEDEPDNGYAVFKGLGEGTYMIEETKAPDNYNGLANPIVVTLDATATVTSIEWSDDLVDMEFENNTFKITVENNKGSSLPTTGGMGTTLIYVLGGMLVLCSIVVIITRKRMEYRQF